MAYGSILGQTPNLANAHGILPVENGGTGVDNLEDLAQALPNYSNIRAIHKQVTTYFSQTGQSNVVVSTNETLGNIFGILIDVKVLSTIVNTTLFFGALNSSDYYERVVLVDGSLNSRQGDFMFFMPANGVACDIDGATKAINFSMVQTSGESSLFNLKLNNNFCPVYNLGVQVQHSTSSNPYVTFNANWDFYFLYFDPNHMPS